MADRSRPLTPGIAGRMDDFVASDGHDLSDAERKEANLRPTGQEIFDSLSKAEQDEMLGPAAAEKVRQGEATLSDFVEHDGNFIRQKPVEEIKSSKVWREEDHPRGGDPKNPGRFSRTAGKVPKWKRDQRYNGWVRSLSPEEQEALARAFYEKLWKQLQSYYGDFGEPPPLLVFTDQLLNPDAQRAEVWMNEQGIRQVQMRRGDILQLAMRGTYRELANTSLLIHEWRHVFQNANLFWIGRDKPWADQPVEQDANAMVNYVQKLIARNRRRKRKGQPLIQPVPYNPQNISENIGKDPTTIPFPVTYPVNPG